VARKGKILATHDGGNVWKAVTSNTNADLEAIYFMDDKNGWVAGTNGTVFVSRDGGQSWQAQNTKGNARLLDIFFADDQNGWAMGENGSILGSHDGGDTWQESAAPTRENLAGIHWIDARQGVIVGSKESIFVTGDGGQSWSSPEYRIYPAPWYFLAVPLFVMFSAWGYRYAPRVPEPVRKPPIFYDLQDVFVSPGGEHLWAVGESGTILNTRNGGQTWQPVYGIIQTKLLGVFFTDDRHGWIVGWHGTLLSTRDGGQSWQASTVNQYLRQKSCCFCMNPADFRSLENPLVD